MVWLDYYIKDSYLHIWNLYVSITTIECCLVINIHLCVFLITNET